jgi:hypothetical protein
MPKEVMRRSASDNTYLHRDFHAALSCGIQYLHDHFGAGAVREYLREFGRTFYAPLREDLRARGLAAVREHFERIYAIEEAEVFFEEAEGELILRVPSCPAVTHMRTHNRPVADLFVETTRTVNEAICEGTPYGAELLEYDPETGRSVQRFFRKGGAA